MIRDVRFSTTGQIVDPLLGQEEFAVDQCCSVRGGIGEKHADLAVVDASGSAAVLAFDASGLGAFFEEASFVDDQDSLTGAEVIENVGAQVVAHLIGVPVSSGEQALDAVGGGFAEAFGDLPAVLAFDGAEESVEVGTSAVALFATCEAPCDAGVEAVEVGRPASYGWCCAGTRHSPAYTS